MWRCADPIWLILLVVPAAVVVLRLRRVLGTRAALGWPTLVALAEARPTLRERCRELPFVLGVLGVAACIGALARPQSGLVVRETVSEGIDIVVAIDRSYSMAAEDFRPDDRLAVAKRVVGEFIRRRAGDRIGLVAFSSRSYTRTPLTLDHELLLEVVAAVDLAGEDEQGTAIGLGLANAVGRLQGSDAKSRVVVLVTDGRDNAGPIDPLTAAQLAAALEVKVYTIGVGSAGPVPIPLGRGRRQVRRYVELDLDEHTLAEIAAMTGGRYFRAAGPDALQEVFATIDALEKSRRPVREQVHYGERFAWLVWPGIAAAVLGLLLDATWLRRVP